MERYLVESNAKFVPEELEDLLYTHSEAVKETSPGKPTNSEVLDKTQQEQCALVL